jgi:carboxylesterase type B
MASIGGRVLLEHYPQDAYPSRTQLLTDVWSDASLVCPTRALACAIAPLEPGKVWRFVFAHAYEAPSLHALGAGHGLELPLLFRNLWPGFQMSQAETTLGDAFTQALSRFVHGGDPGSLALPWLPYDASSDSYLELDTPSSQKRGLRTPQCDFWESVWARR